MDLSQCLLCACLQCFTLAEPRVDFCTVTIKDGKRRGKKKKDSDRGEQNGWYSSSELK